jgi:hypothetical protein
MTKLTTTLFLTFVSMMMAARGAPGYQPVPPRLDREDAYVRDQPIPSSEQRPPHSRTTSRLPKPENTVKRPSPPRAASKQPDPYEIRDYYREREQEKHRRVSEEMFVSEKDYPLPEDMPRLRQRESTMTDEVKLI